MLRRIIYFLLVLILAGCSESQTKDSIITRCIPKDLSGVRGFNYTPANVGGFPRHHIDCWISYDEAVIEHDLDLARRLNLNQVRIFVPYQVFKEDKEGFPNKLLHFVRACYERGIGVMPVWPVCLSLKPGLEQINARGDTRLAHPVLCRGARSFKTCWRDVAKVATHDDTIPYQSRQTQP